jgi:cortactin
LRLTTDLCTDYKKGFGGQYGVQADRKDKSAVGWDEPERERVKQPSVTNDGGAEVQKGRASNLKARFEKLQTGDDVSLASLLS